MSQSENFMVTYSQVVISYELCIMNCELCILNCYSFSIGLYIIIALFSLTSSSVVSPVAMVVIRR